MIEKQTRFWVPGTPDSGTYNRHERVDSSTCLELYSFDNNNITIRRATANRQNINKDNNDEADSKNENNKDNSNINNDNKKSTTKCDNDSSINNNDENNNHNKASS